MGETYNEKWSYIENNKKLKAELNLRFDKKLNMLSNDSFIVDMTNLSISGRKCFTKFKEKGFYVKFVVFTRSMNESLKKENEREGGVISEEVYLQMARSFSFPLFDEADLITLY